MKCKYCGNQIAEGSKKCERCGNKVERTNNRLFLIILFLLLLAGGCVGVYYGLKNAKRHTPTKVIITVKPNDDAMGTVKGSGEYERNETVTIEAIANEGCQFVEWNDGNSNRLRKVVADHNKVYLAKFDSIVAKTPIEGSDTIDEGSNVNDDSEVSEIPVAPVTPVIPRFMITVESADPNMGTVKGGGEYDSLALIKIEAQPKNGYQFISWTDGDKNKIRTVKVLCDQEYKAQFSKKPQSDDITPHQEGQPGKGKKNYWFGRYEGNLKNGIPEGRGIMYYHCHVQIAKYQSSSPGVFAEEGDYFDGNWKNGDIYTGSLYNKDGVLKYENIRVKPRTRPYDLEKDEYIK